jgi:uncharacterized protein (DUF2141 family)
MFTKIGILLFLLVSGIEYLAAETLTTRIENADVGMGQLMVGIFNDEKTFPDTYFRGERAAVSETTMVITLQIYPKNDMPYRYIRIVIIMNGLIIEGKNESVDT